MAGDVRIISGSDEFAIKKRQRSIAVEWSGNIPPEENTEWEIIRGDDGMRSNSEILGDCAAALRTPPFLTEQKTVFLSNFSGFGELDAGETEEAFQNLLKILQGGLPDDIRFLAGGAGLDGRKASAKALKNCPGIIIETFTMPDPKRKDTRENMRLKLEEYATAMNKRLDARAQELVLAAVGTDTAQMYSELDKLFTWQGEDNSLLTAEDLQKVISASGEAPGWELAEALRNRDMDRAFALLGQLLHQMKGRSGAELSLLYTAAGAFEDILRTKAEMHTIGIPERFGPNYFQGITEEEKKAHPDCSLFKIHPYRAFKLCEAARNFSPVQMSKIFSALLEANIAMVNGIGKPVVVLDKMIRTICRA